MAIVDGVPINDIAEITWPLSFTTSLLFNYSLKHIDSLLILGELKLALSNSKQSTANSAFLRSTPLRALVSPSGQVPFPLSSNRTSAHIHLCSDNNPQLNTTVLSLRMSLYLETGSRPSSPSPATVRSVDFICSVDVAVVIRGLPAGFRVHRHHGQVVVLWFFSPASAISRLTVPEEFDLSNGVA